MGDDRKDEPLRKLASGFASRTLATAKLGLKVGAKYAARTVAGATSAKDAAKEAKRVADAVKSAEELVKQLGALKGLAMKGGQMISYLHGAMPPEAQRVLARLQAESTPMAFDVVEEVLRAELGGGAVDRFEAFEKQPFAAASIGQVHRARHQGRPVAVKIQYPEIGNVLENELKAASVFARLGTLGSAIDGAEVIRELRDRTREECDYENEANNQRLFRDLLGDVPGAIVPEVITDRSRRRVLTTAFEPGRAFQPFADAASQARKDEAAATIFRASFGSIFRHCVYNADPHPGNYLFPDEGGVVFLDYGCVRRFDATMVDRWKALARAALDGDRPGWKEQFIALGLAPRPDRFDWDHQWDVQLYLYKPFIERNFTYDGDYVASSFKLMIFDNPNKNRTGMPAEWVLVNRLQWGLNSVLAHLGATGDWRGMWREMIEAPTVPREPIPQTAPAC